MAQSIVTPDKKMSTHIALQRLATLTTRNCSSQDSVKATGKMEHSATSVTKDAVSVAAQPS
jgi:hypothetical protein